MMHLAICSDIKEFKADQLRDEQWSRKFPGSGWITCLYDLATRSSINISSGDIAIQNIKSNKWVATDVNVIQDMASMEAEFLLTLGAKPFLITCFESHLYAPSFYRNIAQIADKFIYKMGFPFAGNQFGIAGSMGSMGFRFPTFYVKDIKDIRPWSPRKNLVLVAANKYRVSKVFKSSRLSMRGLMRQVKTLAWKLFDSNYRHALAYSLHDRRLEAIEHFSTGKNFDIYGKGWDQWDELPSTWARRLEQVTRGRYQGVCQDKIDLISNYRYSICFENMAMPGYITEKMIDCFVAGTLPIYLGAPDVENFVPANSFIDMRVFQSLDQVEVFMSSLDDKTAMAMIMAGRDYLKTELGQLHSYEGFADHVFKLAMTC